MTMLNTIASIIIAFVLWFLVVRWAVLYILDKITRP